MGAPQIRQSLLFLWTILFVSSSVRGQTTDVRAAAATPMQAVGARAAQQAGNRAPGRIQQPSTVALLQSALQSKTDLAAQLTPRQPVVRLEPSPPHKKLTGPLNPNLAYPPDFLDEGFRLESSSLPELNAPVGSRVMVKLAVDGTGNVNKMTYWQGDWSLCTAVAQAAISHWRFSRPTLNGRAVKASATVTVQF